MDERTYKVLNKELKVLGKTGPQLVDDLNSPSANKSALHLPLVEDSSRNKLILGSGKGLDVHD